MWRPINANQKTYFIKCDQGKDCHKIYLSDLVNAWMETLTLSSLSKRCKELNSRVEAEAEDLAKHIQTLITNGEEGLRITVNEDWETTMLHIESKLAETPFYFKFRLEKMNADAFYRVLTIPLMLLAVNQQSQLIQLRDMLIAKDAEIEQYKLEGAVLKKRKVETEPFNENLLGPLHQAPSSCNATESVNLFSKLCALLPTSPTFEACLSDREEELSEVKHEAEPLPLSISEMPVKAEESSSDLIVKEKITKSKKPKLRI